MPSSLCVGGKRMSTIAMSGVCLRTLTKQLLGGFACADDLDSCITKNTRDALAEQHAVLRDHGAQGISARTRVPPLDRAPHAQPSTERLHTVRESP